MCHPSTCSNCRFFQPEGHYHGSCARLHSMVMGEWPGCRLGRSTFESSEELPDRQEDLLVVVAAMTEQRSRPTVVEERSLQPC